MKLSSSSRFGGFLALLSVSALVGLMGCAATTDQEDDDQGVSTEEAFTTGITPGTFRLYNDPGHVITPGCDIHTKLQLSNIGGAKATLSEEASGLCQVAIAPNRRAFRLRQTGGSCGSKVYEGHRNVTGGVNKVKITDHRSRMCMDVQVAQVIVEETVPGFPGAITTTLYSTLKAPPVPPASVTVEGNLFTSFGIGGENTGRSIQLGNGDVFELVLDASEQSRFASGKLARVKGKKTFLSGVETQNRAAINVDDLLVCPNAGAINCMPPVNGSAQSLCAPANRSWIESKCAGVEYLD
jgi:hypothetical protein